MKNELFDIANMPKYGYINRALSKISKLALVGYKCNKGAQSAYRAFLCVISLCVRISLWRSWRGTPSGVQVSFVPCRPTLFSFATLIWS